MSKYKAMPMAAMALTLMVMFASDANAYTSVKSREVTGDVTKIPLLASREKTVVGEVSISNVKQDGLYKLLVCATMLPGYSMKSYHAHAARTFSEIPQTRSGNDKKGAFEFSEEFQEVVSSTGILVMKTQMESFGAGSNFVFALHVDVVFPNGDIEGAWADGLPFPGGNIATYVTYVVKCVSAALVLPDTLVAKAHHEGATSYWDIEFAIRSELEGTSLDGLETAPGWCANEHLTRPNNLTSTFKVSSMLNPDEGVNSEINYAMNFCTGSSINDMQEVLWEIFVPGSGVGLSQAQLDCVEMARVLGENFEPGVGEVVGIALNADEDLGRLSQPLFFPFTIECE